LVEVYPPYDLDMDIKEDKEKSLLFIDGKPLSGYIDDGVCPKCNEKRIYSDKFDAYFCIKCNEWLEDQCSDPYCEYCAKRPPKPSEIPE
jgi:hypothetical protein